MRSLGKISTTSGAQHYRREPTVTKDHELFALSSSNLAKKGQQVEWNTLRVLAHDATGVGTARVEVPQQSTIPLLERLAGLLEVVALSVDVVGNEILDSRLCAAVGVGRTNGAVLGNGNHVLEASGIAVDGGRRGEDDVGDIVTVHGTEQSDASADIDAIVFKWLLARLANGLKRQNISSNHIQIGSPMGTFRAAK